ncbi:MAG: TonB-dependent receptor [bacterium]|nr:TonB-dependent receptor [bacterium]
MNKNILYLVILLGFLVAVSPSIAQNQKLEKGKATIFGKVMDGNLNEPIPFATVMVTPAENEDLVTGQITNDQGLFQIKDVPSGLVIVEIQFVGYKSVSREIRIDKGNTKLDLGTILMYDDVEILDAVEVTAERSTIEQKVDRKIINIGKDLATTGPTAADLMVNIPSVNVDQDGGISMRGNDNVLVLVDGKPTNQNATQLLESIPSGSIKSIELITNPSAKYVPDGMSGIINIILHKNTNLGFNGKVNAGLTIGEELRRNAAIDLNYRTQKINFFLNYANTDGPMPTWGTIDRFSDNSNEVWFSLNDRTSHLVKTGLDFDLSSSTVVSVYSIFNDFKNQAFRSTDIIYPEPGTLDFGQEYSSEVDNVTKTFNFDIKHKFNENSALELEVDHSIFEGNESADFEFYGDAFDLDEAIELISNNRDNTTINLDFENSFGSNKRLELGLEARIQRTNNDYSTTNPNFNNSIYALNRDIYAGYFTFSHKLGKWSYQLGARFEDFDQRSDFGEDGSESVQYNDVIRSVYPSAFLTYTPNPESRKDAINFSVSRRVDRPNINQLNPMRAWSSARITNVGNPSLIPQFTNSVEVNYTRQLEKGSVTSGVFYRRIFDEITRFGFNDEENPGNILFSYDNYQNNSAYGFELSGNFQITSKWGFNSSFDIYSQTQRGVAQDEFREVQNVIYNFRTNHSFKASKKLTFQLIGLYRGGNTNLQYRTLSFYFVNIGARYQLFKGKGALSVNFNDVFHTQRFAFSGERPVSQEGNYNWDSQTLFVGYSHKFGKSKKRSPKRKKRDNNEKKSVGGF